VTEWAQFVSYGGAERREKILAEKRRRYQEDEEHRRAVQERARAGYTPKARPSARKRGPNKPKPYVLPNGRLTVLIGLGQLAAECGVTKQAIRRYEEHGVIPRNHMVDDRNRRWYPRDFAAFLVPLLREQAKLREPLRCLAARVERAWRRAVESGAICPLPKESRDGEESYDDGGDHASGLPYGAGRQG